MSEESLSVKERIARKKRDKHIPSPFGGFDTPPQGLDDDALPDSPAPSIDEQDNNIASNISSNLSSDIDSNSSISSDNKDNIKQNELKTSDNNSDKSNDNVVSTNNEIATTQEQKQTNNEDVQVAMLQAVELLKNMGFSLNQIPSINKEVNKEVNNEDSKEKTQEVKIPIAPTWKQKRDNTVAKGMRIGSYPATLLRIANSITGKTQQSIVEDLIIEALEPLYKQYVDPES